MSNDIYRETESNAKPTLSLALGKWNFLRPIEKILSMLRATLIFIFTIGILLLMVFSLFRKLRVIPALFSIAKDAMAKTLNSLKKGLNAWAASIILDYQNKGPKLKAMPKRASSPRYISQP